MILNPNCSETVIRLKKKDIKNLDREEERIYIHLLNNAYQSNTPVEGYSKLRSDDIWKAHYYYQTVGNELVAFAYWLGLEFDTDEVWHSGDIIDMDKDTLKEYLSQMFTEFEDIFLYPNCSEWSTELDIDISELNGKELKMFIQLLGIDISWIKNGKCNIEISSEELYNIIERLPFRGKIIW